jgi:hypothetical protein
MLPLNWANLCRLPVDDSGARRFGSTGSHSPFRGRQSKSPDPGRAAPRPFPPRLRPFRDAPRAWLRVPLLAASTLCQWAAQRHSKLRRSGASSSCGLPPRCSITSLRSPITVMTETWLRSTGRYWLLVFPETTVAGTLRTPDRAWCAPAPIEPSPVTPSPPRAPPVHPTGLDRPRDGQLLPGTPTSAAARTKPRHWRRRR